jgi:hypothetical protein
VDVSSQGEFHLGRVLRRAQPFPGDIAYDETDPVFPERKGVVKVASDLGFLLSGLV